MGKNIIVACDFSSKEQLTSFLDEIEAVDEDIYCKVGMELFDNGVFRRYNPVELIKGRGHKVFLDLKLHDIPNTVSKTIKQLVEYGVDLTNIHASGGYEMMKAAVDAVDKVYKKYEEEYKELENNHSYPAEALKHELEKKLSSKPIILGVTVLTSISDEVLKNELGNETVIEIFTPSEKLKYRVFSSYMREPDVYAFKSNIVDEPTQERYI